jgi:hypothetical protein
MRFDDLYTGYAQAGLFMDPWMIKHDQVHRCAVCKSFTRYEDLRLQMFVCSEECADKMSARIVRRPEEE